MSDTLFKVKRLHDLAQAGLLKGKRVLIRSDLNVPQDEAGNITEDTRIRASIPAIEICLQAGAAVMVTSHLGRPTEGQFKPEDSLAPVAHRIAEMLNRQGLKVSGDFLWYEYECPNYILTAFSISRHVNSGNCTGEHSF